MKKPSVTELLDLLNKPALMNWANKIGLQGIKLSEYRKEKTTSGTNIHNQLEKLLKYGEEIEDKYLQNAIINQLKTYEVVGVEEPIETEYYQGRCDLILSKNKELYVFDFKRGFKKPYLEHYLQLTAYQYALNADRIGIIRVPQVDIIELTNDKKELYQELLINLSNIYKIKQSI